MGNAFLFLMIKRGTFGRAGFFCPARGTVLTCEIDIVKFARSATRILAPAGVFATPEAGAVSAQASPATAATATDARTRRATTDTIPPGGAKRERVTVNRSSRTN